MIVRTVVVPNNYYEIVYLATPLHMSWMHLLSLFTFCNSENEKSAAKLSLLLYALPFSLKFTHITGSALCKYILAMFIYIVLAAA